MGKVTSLFTALTCDWSTARAEALNTKIKGHVVDTVYAHDTGEYETGIQSKKYPSWVIVQQYGPDKEKAKRGHAKWVKKIRDGVRTFDDVVEYGF